MRKLFLRAARGERTDRPPVWCMRQAGRYLPEYRKIRSEYSFTEAIRTPTIAKEISLQPWERFKPDGVVMYSDILTALDPLDVAYHLEPGIGPVIENPVRSPEEVPTMVDSVVDSIGYVGELLELLSEELAGQSAVIGFAGGPFTLSAYLVEGRPTRSFMEVRKFRITNPESYRNLLRVITDVILDSIDFQISSGADVIQVFDTYAGLLPPDDYRTFILPLHQQIFESIPESIPSIIFIRNSAGNLLHLKESGADVIGLDWTVKMETARAQLGSIPVQGNLDPAVLFGTKQIIHDRTVEVIEAAGKRGHILNLGHGVDKETPVEGIGTFIETAKNRPH